MKNKKKKIITITLIVFLLAAVIYILFYNKTNNTNLVNKIGSNIESAISSIDWDEYSSKEITLTKSIKITEEGTYTLTGTIEDGLIYINTDGNVRLILNSVSITNKNGPAIYVENAKNIEISTAEGTTNTLTDSSNYINYDEDVTGCIYSKDDLILSGKGTLKITANYKDGIVSKDDLKITSGIYIITAKDDGIKGKDSIEIEAGTFTITTGGDGIKSTNNKDSEKGYIVIDNGTYTINSTNDGIQVETKLIINSGTFNIKTTGNTNEDSAKGLKAGTLVEINGGTYNMNTIDDGIHSNGNISINKGEIIINSKDDGIHADGLVEINSGTFNITAAEGIEGTYVKINDGKLNISASDDGINAGDKSNAYSATIEINGGNITIKMGQGDTDGIDSNGDLYINGGTIDITAQSPFDYDKEAKYTGGTIIVNGITTNQITNQMMGGPGGGNTPNNGERRRGPIR